MAQPLYRHNSPSRIKENTKRVRREERKPVMPGPYIYVSGGTGDVSPLETWQSPEWQNNFTWFEDNYVGFRHGVDGFTEFIGILDLTQGSSTGDVAFTLPVPFRAISFHFTFPVFVEGTEWWAGILKIDKTTGDVTVYWPIEATPI